MNYGYDIGDFNDQGELKTPAGLILALIFLARHLLFLLLAGLSEFMSRGGDFQVASLGLPPVWALIYDIPLIAFLLLVLRKDKLPDSGVLRRILYRGAPLLLGLAVLQLVLSIFLELGDLRHPGLKHMADTVLMVMCIFYLASNDRIRRFFKEYGRR